MVPIAMAIPASDIMLASTPNTLMAMNDISTAMGALAFPGAFEGVLDDGVTSAQIVSFGTVEFVFTQDGQELQLVPGSTATIDMPLYVDAYPNGDPIQVGDNVPLWFLDELTGIWQQEGEGEVIAKPASKTGLAMRATVTHFTWWNTDWYPSEAERKDITVTVNAVDGQGNVMPDMDGAPVRVTAQLMFNPSSLRPMSITYNTPATGPAFEGLWCFQATDIVTRYSSEKVCMNIEGGEEIPLTVYHYFRVSHNLPETATAGVEIGANGSNPRISVSSRREITFSVVSGSLPDGLEIAPDGALVGIPTRAGTFTFQVDVEEFLPDGTRSDWDLIIHTIEVFPPLEVRAFDIQVVFNVGYPSTFNPFVVEGGMPPYAPLRLAPDGYAPPGMQLFNDQLTGTPGRVLANGVVQRVYATPLSVIAEDANGATATDSYPQYVLWAPLLSGEAPVAVVGEPYTYTPTNSEGPIDHWEVIEGLPAWASVNTVTGEVTGVPGPEDVGVESEVTVHAVGPALEVILFDGITPTGGHAFVLRVIMNPPEVIADVGDLTVGTGQLVTVTPVNIGEVAAYWEVDNLPGWAAFDSTTGQLTGTPPSVGEYADIVIRAVNAGGSSETESFTITVIAQTPAPVLAGAAPDGTVGVSYGFTVQNTGGAVDTWQIAGTLPPGISFADGAFSGVPTSAGVYSGIQVSAGNAGGTDSLGLSITVLQGQQAPLVFDIPGPIDRLVGDAAFTNIATGGAGTGGISYASSDTGAATVNPATGEVTILGPGETTVTATRAADTDYLAQSASYLLRITEPILMTGTPHPALINNAYEWQPVLSGATAVLWELLAGPLPSGLSLDDLTGVISGTTDESGQFPFSLGARLSDDTQVVGAFTLNVIQSACIPGGEGLCALYALVDESSLFAFDVSIDNPMWSIDGSLPAGMSFDTSTGYVSGTPTETGEFSFSVTATDPAGPSEMIFVALSITEGLPT